MLPQTSLRQAGAGVVTIRALLIVGLILLATPDAKAGLGTYMTDEH